MLADGADSCPAKAAAYFGTQVGRAERNYRGHGGEYGGLRWEHRLPWTEGTLCPRYLLCPWPRLALRGFVQLPAGDTSQPCNTTRYFHVDPHTILSCAKTPKTPLPSAVIDCNADSAESGNLTMFERQGLPAHEVLIQEHIDAQDSPLHVHS